VAELSDPARSQAVLVGVHEYSDLDGLPAVARNLEGLRRALTDPAVWGLPGAACTVVAQPATAGQVLDAVRAAAHRAEDTLLVYYAGHGLTDPYNDELYLALPDSARDREYTSLRYEYLRRAVLDAGARAKRTVVVLDCCYSGRAMLGKMSASTYLADRAVVEGAAGTCLLTASAETRPALSPPGERYTAFTGELITALTQGIEDRPDPLDMDTLFRHLDRTLEAKSRPRPQQRSRNGGGRIAVARNRAAAHGNGNGSGDGSGDGDSSAAADRRREAEAAAERRLAQLEQLAEQVRAEAEQFKEQAELRAREALETAVRLARAVTAGADPNFRPFWFAVPEPRPLYAQDGSLTPLDELKPGTWYLAVEKWGDALFAQTDDGGRGYLLDTSGIEHGVSDVGTQEAAQSGFQPFWFAVPEPRPLYAHDGSPTPVAQLLPGAWYLARGQSAYGLVTETQDGRRGLLPDTSGIERGDSGLLAEGIAQRVVRKARNLLQAVAAEPEPDFRSFWFAVPVTRPLFAQDGSPTPVAHLMVGQWYLAMDRLGDALLARTADGRQGLLLDTSGIEIG
jgi:uncharacterized caspase-like protein